jgi:hypothetical protein
MVEVAAGLDSSRASSLSAWPYSVAPRSEEGPCKCMRPKNVAAKARNDIEAAEDGSDSKAHANRGRLDEGALSSVTCKLSIRYDSSKRSSAVRSLAGCIHRGNSRESGDGGSLCDEALSRRRSCRVLGSSCTNTSDRSYPSHSNRALRHRLQVGRVTSRDRAPRQFPMLLLNRINSTHRTQLFVACSCDRPCCGLLRSPWFGSLTRR